MGLGEKGKELLSSDIRNFNNAASYALSMGTGPSSMQWLIAWSMLPNFGLEYSLCYLLVM